MDIVIISVNMNIYWMNKGRFNVFLNCYFGLKFIGKDFGGVI